MFNSYMPKQVSDGAGNYGYDEMSDFDNEIDAMDEESGDDGGLAGNK